MELPVKSPAQAYYFSQASASTPCLSLYHYQTAKPEGIIQKWSSSLS
jgi:hypothetical protein|tara:strand:- start:221 stop:361 length:141 start_codon:yes stop_codon:yes gene_type:complete